MECILVVSDFVVFLEKMHINVNNSNNNMKIGVYTINMHIAKNPDNMSLLTITPMQIKIGVDDIIIFIRLPIFSSHSTIMITVKLIGTPHSAKRYIVLRFQ